MPANHSHPRRILIVATETATDTAADGLRATVTSLGYEVIGVAADTAAVRIQEGAVTPELILVDCAGHSDAAWMAATTRLRTLLDLPVVGLLADETSALAHKAVRDRPSGYLVRPFSQRELHATVELALSTHAAAHAADAIEERFFAVAIDLLCVLDFSGYFTRLNPAWERALGFSATELMSRPFIEFVHPDDRARTLEQNRRVREGAQALAFENRYLCKDGTFRWLRWNAAPDTPFRAIYSVARDVTESKRAGAERDQLVGELQAALAEVDTLQAILPICSYCRRIRDDQDYWHSVEGYIARHTRTRFSHGVCPGCMVEQVEPQLRALEDDPGA